MARTGMADVISELRALTNAGTADYTIAGSTYWTDDQMQAELDKTQTRRVERLIAEPVTEPSGDVYRMYRWTGEYVERATGGSAVWQLRDAVTFAPIGTASYSANYQTRRVTFPSDQSSTALFSLEYYMYDVYAAAASVYRRMAAHVAARFDITTDNHTLKRSQLREGYLRLAREMEQSAGGRMVVVRRTDSNW